MKNLFLIIIMIISSIITKAQPSVFANNITCDLEFRQICIDTSRAPSGCFVVATGAWISAPALSVVTIPGNTCGPKTMAGYEIRYAPSTGCTASVAITWISAICSAYPLFSNLPSCSCTANPSPHVFIAGTVLTVQ